MSRPLNRGPVISIRLPLTVDRKVRHEAARRGLSVGTYIANKITREHSALPPESDAEWADGTAVEGDQSPVDGASPG